MAVPTNEMNLPLISAPAMGVTGAVAASMTAQTGAMDPADEYSYDADVAVGMPDNGHDAANITVWANTITPTSYDPVGGPVVAFDVVFSVGISNGQSSKTYQVVKRIGIDKLKLAAQAESGSPVSVVEEKSTLSAETRKRIRRLAGLD